MKISQFFLVSSLSAIVIAAPGQGQHGSDQVRLEDRCDPQGYWQRAFPMSLNVPFVVEVMLASTPGQALFDKPQYLSLEKNTKQSDPTIIYMANPLQHAESSQDIATFRFGKNGTLTADGFICGLGWENWGGGISRTLSCPAPSTLNEQCKDWSVKSACIDKKEKLILLPFKDEGSDSQNKEVWLVNGESGLSHERKPRIHYAQLDKQKPGKYYSMFIIRFYTNVFRLEAEVYLVIKTS
jgi:hypothetical protein